MGEILKAKHEVKEVDDLHGNDYEKYYTFLLLAEQGIGDKTRTCYESEIKLGLGLKTNVSCLNASSNTTKEQKILGYSTCEQSNQAAHLSSLVLSQNDHRRG
jgi:hypothetical protein